MGSEDIKKLVPQRDPILMVDSLMEANGDVAVTCLSIRADSYFIDEERRLAETGIIEHIAQSASAFAGYRAMLAGAADPPVGYIGEVKKFRCYRCPQVGDELRTTITMGAEMAGVTIITGEVRLSGGDEIVADTQMKIFIKTE